MVLALHALAKSGADLQLHSVLDERAAGFMALGLSRACCGPVLLSCTSGSAGAHYLPAIIEASHAHIPLIALTADRPPELQGRGAPQTIDQSSLFGVHVRHTICLEPPEADTQIPRLAGRKAIECAMGANTGPVHINAQYRKPLWHPLAPATVDVRDAPPFKRAPLHLPDSEIQALSDRLMQAKRGLFVWGPDPDPALDPTQVLRLSSHLGWPILATPTSPARFRANGQGHIITASDAFLRSPQIAEALAPDLVIQLGGTPSSNALRALVGAAPDVVAIDPRGVWRDPEHSLKTLLCADLDPVAHALCSRLPARATHTWLAEWNAHEQRATQALSEACRDGWWSGSITRGVLDALPTGALLNTASSMPIRDLDGFGRGRGSALHTTSSRGANGIDGTVATTIGLARAWSSGPVAALMGDLTFLHDHSSLLLARDLKQPVVVIVIDNGGGGIFSHLPISAHEDAFEPWFLTPHSVDIPSLCTGAGVTCTQVSTMASLRAALGEALDQSRLTVLHLPIDREDDLKRHRLAWTEAQRS